MGGNWTMVCCLSDGGAFFAGVWALSCGSWFTRVTDHLRLWRHILSQLSILSKKSTDSAYRGQTSLQYLARSLIIQNIILGRTKFVLKIFLKPLQSSLLSFRFFSKRVYPLLFRRLKYFQLYYPKFVFLTILLLSTAVYAQDYSELVEDPYLDPTAANLLLQPTTRAVANQAYMFGISYGLNPIILLAPAVSIGMYWDPLVLGLEISDSESLGIWEKERRENLGEARLSGETQFIKWFYSENFYLIVARESRSIKLWNRTYNRISGRAMFDMFVKTKLASLGAGYLRFGNIGFFSIDIIRYNLVKNHSVEVVEYYETWSELSGNRDALDQNIQDRSNKWIKTINAPTGFVLTFGVFF